MIRQIIYAIILQLFAGCAIIEHVQVLPSIDMSNYSISCCVVYAEIGKNAKASLEVIKTNQGLKVNSTFHYTF